ncbi:MAG: threonine aldolase family protein [Stackebrandtia sp.]
MHVDLRSDTVTRPGPQMRQAMAEAEVGDDVFGDDPTVNALQDEVAALLGKEAALFVPSGSMANEIAVQLLVSPGEELLADSEAHVVAHESGAAAVVGGITTRTWHADRGRLDVDAVERLVHRAGYPSTPTRAIAVENTHGAAGGVPVPVETLRRLRAVADAHGVKVHCDGARLWHAHVAHGVPLREYGALFDTVSTCLSKGLGAPVGSLVASTADNIARARRLRHRMGGAMRQVGILAAAGRYAVAHHVERLAEDHARARRLAEALEPFGVVAVADVPTNIVMLRVGEARRLVEAAAEQGVLSAAMSPDVLRLVTHLDVDDDGIDHAIEVLTGLLRKNGTS